MSESRQHRRISERIAKADGVPYNSQRGPDIKTPERVTEVGVDPARVKQEMSQVARSQKARYVAGPSDFVKAAIKATKGTGIGVRNSRGQIVKRASRPKK